MAVSPNLQQLVFRDTNNGLHYLYYDSTLGGFIFSDPVFNLSGINQTIISGTNGYFAGTLSGLNIIAGNSLTIDALNGVLRATGGLVAGSSTTSNLPEGSNLYYTDQRAHSAITTNSPLFTNSGLISGQFASALQSGFLSSTDWNTFNSKQATLTFNAPLVLVGTIVSGNFASATESGFITAANFNAFQSGYTQALTLSGYLKKSGDSVDPNGTLNTPTLSGTNILLGNGSNGTPALRFGGDTNTGISWGGADILMFNAGGQASAGIAAGGGVGRLFVGNSNSPASRFQIVDDTNVPTGGITLGATSATAIQIFKSASNQLTISGTVNSNTLSGTYITGNFVTANNTLTISGLNGFLYAVNGLVGISGLPPVTTYTYNAPLVLNGTVVSGNFSNTTESGFLLSTDWNTFNSKFSSSGGFLTGHINFPTSGTYNIGSSAFPASGVYATAIFQSGDAVILSGKNIATSFVGTVFHSKQGSTLLFKNILGSGPISMTNNSNDVTLGLGTSVPALGYLGSTKISGNYISGNKVDVRDTLTISGLNGFLYAVDGAVGISGLPPATTFTYNAPLVLNGTAISGKYSSATESGFLLSADWNTFNNKQIAISAQAPLVLTNGILSGKFATIFESGFLSAADFTTFNNKQNALTFNAPLILNGTNVSGNFASATESGFLKNTDWNAFNSGYTLGLTLSGYLKKAGDTATGTINAPVLSGSLLSGDYLTLTNNLVFTSNQSTIALPKVGSTPTPINTGNLVLYSQSLANFNMLVGQYTSGSITAYQPAMFSSNPYVVFPTFTNSITSTAGAVNISGTITCSNVEPYGYGANLATMNQNISGLIATVWPNGSSALRGSQSGINGFFFAARVTQNDNTTAIASGTTTYAGMFGSNLTVLGKLTSGISNYCSFHYSTTRGDTNWQFVTCNNSVITATNTSMPYLGQKVYDLFIYAPKNAFNALYWQVNNVTDGTTNQGSVTATLPGGTAQMTPGISITNGDSTTQRNLRMSHIYLMPNL